VGPIPVTRTPFINRAIVAMILVSASVADAQTRTAAAAGSVVGIVRDSAGVAIAQVAIGVVGTTSETQRTMTNQSGVYGLAGLGPGTIRLLARRIGYAPETSSVVVVAGETVTANVILAVSAVELAPAVVESDATRGKMGPFNQRRARGVGAFITRADIEKRQAGSISELLRYLPGVGVTQKMAGEPQPVHMQRSVNSTMQGSCTVQLYVDGHPYPNGNVDDFAPGGMEGIEVYKSASEIPAAFRTRDATCGVIALWTRDPEAARRRP
jgi:hypothetical protein